MGMVPVLKQKWILTHTQLCSKENAVTGNDSNIYLRSYNCLYGLIIFSKDPYTNFKPKCSNLFRKLLGSECTPVGVRLAVLARNLDHISSVAYRIASLETGSNYYNLFLKPFKEQL